MLVSKVQVELGIQEILPIPDSWCKIRDVYEPLSQGGQSLKMGF